MANSTLSPVQGQGGLPCIHLHAANGATACIYLQGAHVASWCVPELGEQLFMSAAANFGEGKALRGGVPVIFPQFGLFGTGPKHGFARTAQWQLDASASNAQQAVLRLNQGGLAPNACPFAFSASLEVTLGQFTLDIALTISNTDSAAFSFTSALHSYFAVAHLHATHIHGLGHSAYWDNGTPVDQRNAPQQGPLAVRGALDRVYFNTPSALSLQQPSQWLHIVSKGFADTVVWNPGLEGATELPDMQANEYLKMLCIESAVVEQPVCLQAGEQWRGVQSLRVEAT